MNNKTWIVALDFTPEEPIEPRVALIVQYLAQIYPDAIWIIDDIDATSPLGNDATNQVNNMRSLSLSSGSLLEILNGDGQVFELDAVLTHKQERIYRVFLRAGSHVVVIGTRQLIPHSILGRYRQLENDAGFALD